jgi:hypothetical protein
MHIRPFVGGRRARERDEAQVDLLEKIRAGQVQGCPVVGAQRHRRVPQIHQVPELPIPPHARAWSEQELGGDGGPLGPAGRPQASGAEQGLRFRGRLIPVDLYLLRLH